MPLKLTSETRTWDRLGHPATVSNALGAFTLSYTTSLPRLDSVSGPGGLVSTYTYNANTAPGDRARALAGITHTLGGIDYHWLMGTPEPNLIEGMKCFQNA